MTLEGIGTARAHQLAAALRDVHDEERWGPTHDRLATVAWQPPGSIAVSYRALDDPGSPPAATTGHPTATDPLDKPDPINEKQQEAPQN